MLLRNDHVENVALSDNYELTCLFFLYFRVNPRTLDQHIAILQY